LLLAGWLAAQLHWTFEKNSIDTALAFRDRAKRTIQVSLGEKAGEPISRCLLKCSTREFCVSHSANADLLDVAAQGADVERKCLMPAGRNDPVQLMSEELMRGGPHRVYLRAMNSVRELL
jgi:hypothetical protein